MNESFTRKDGPIKPSISLFEAQMQAYRFCVINRRFNVGHNPVLIHLTTVAARYDDGGVITDGYYVIHREPNPADDQQSYEHHVFASSLGAKNNEGDCLNLIFEHTFSRSETDY